jgi:uncharacterized phage protein gp47/JayE
MGINGPLDYTSRDFTAIKADLKARIPDFIPEWTDTSDADFGIVMVDLFSHMGDVLNYYIDRIAQEAFLQTATQRQSVLNIASMLGYTPVQQQAATIPVTLDNQATPQRNGGVQVVIAPNAGGPVTIPTGTQVVTGPGPNGEAPVVFETITARTIAIGGTDYVDAIEGTTITLEQAGQSTGGDLQQFKLSFSGVVFGSIQVYVAEGPGTTGSPTNVLWKYFAQITDAGPIDSAYTITQDNTGNSFIVFGDGTNGRIPPMGLGVFVTYRYGVGLAGNVGTNAVVSFAQAIVGTQSVTNNVAASGGTDVESMDSMRISIPRSVKSLNRAVTVDDYANLALQVPGVVRALAAGSFFTTVTVYIAPVGGGQPSTTLTTSVRTYLSTRSVVGTVTSVTGPRYMPVNISITVNVLSAYNQASVISSVRTQLELAFLFDNRDFGEIISVGEIYRLLQDIIGVDFVTITKMVRSDASNQAIVENIDPASTSTHGTGQINDIFTKGTFIYTGVGGIT